VRPVSTAVLDRAPAAPSYAMVTALDEFASLVRRLIEEKKPVGFDTETGYHGPDREYGGVRAEINYIVCIQLTNSLEWARMIPLAFDSPPNLDNRSVAALMWELAHAVDDEGLPLLVPHNAFAELRWMARFFLRYLWDHPLYGRQVIAARGYYPLRSDTILERYVEAESPALGLKDLTPQHFGIEMASIRSLFNNGLTDEAEDSIRFNTLDQHRPDVIAYACDDAQKGLMHHLATFPRVRHDKIFQLEMAILPIVCEMADYGLHVDWAYIRESARVARDFEQMMLADIVDSFNQLLAAKGRPRLPVNFNFNSSQQLVRLFHEWLELPVVYWTQGSEKSPPRPSVDSKNAIPKLARMCPAIGLYDKWKKLNTLRTHFMEIYESKYCWADDGYAHCELKQFGTVPGRFSCKDFNYQQLPGAFEAELSDGERFEFSFRKAIKAPPPGWRPWWELVLEDAGAPAELYQPEEGRDLGWYILGYDYSQQELRVLASLAGETRLIEDFRSGADVHRRTAALMLGVPEAQVTKKQRKKGKTRNFANVYGQGLKALADQLGESIEEARAKDAQYRQLYPRLKPAREKAITQARRNGFLITYFGRKVAIHDYKDPNPKVQAKGDMTAGNAFVQGPATGDYVKMAMVRAVRALRRAGLQDKVRLVMNIHDALEFYVRKDVSPALVIKVLQDAVVFPVRGWLPMVADWHMGMTWGGVRELEIMADGNVRLKPEEDDEPPPPPAEPASEPGGGTQPVHVPAAPAPEPEQPADPEPDGGSGIPGGPGRTVTITMDTMPRIAQVQQLRDLLAGMPGPNTVVLSTPDGEVVVRGTSSLTPQDAPRVAVVLGRVAVTVDQVDAAALADGLDL
jgi:DNA polymerase I-like protein with 3'-5' exonuclease and polymerase domains